MPEVVSDFARLSARFSFRDLPDFLVIPCRGDLSAIACPCNMGAWLVPIRESYAPLLRRCVPARREDLRATPPAPHELWSRSILNEFGPLDDEKWAYQLPTVRSACSR